MSFAEDLVGRFGSSPWGPMALAFLFGVAFGWVIWGLRSKDDGADGESPAPLGEEAAKEIVVIKAEIEAVRRLLHEKDGEEGAIGDQLSTLDETVKRANGRLKVVVAAIRRAATRD